MTPMAVYRAARDWADQHGHPQPDDRLVDLIYRMASQGQTTLHITSGPPDIRVIPVPYDPRTGRSL
ncbi:hypothetical protein EDC02_5924 [Micromonospora sp. Llam0]|uniref:hypothetical protein n=1 Tax=Micromonospora sp. Llam0 TaxID=2485143 RepID=UPI000F9E1BC3|nr:hypothetical protein [Micromonospora sp. Llam0]ROO51060.1 hypothetical protein EDC02_5924 [Micromonospora sp. Llam0]